MKGKSLGLRFLVLGALLALAALALFTKPLKKGMDLEGGHSLIFKVDTENVSDKRATVNAVINTLRERVDPQGVMNLQWWPVGDDRIEVRMPVGSPVAREAQLAFVEALEALTEQNVTPAFIRRVTNAPPEDREALIAERVGAESDRAELLREVASLHDTIEREEAAIADRLAVLEEELVALQTAEQVDLEKVDGKQTEIDRLTEVLDQAKWDYRQAVDTLLGKNLRPSHVMAVLKLYDPPKIARQMKEEDVKARRELFKADLAALREAHPQVADQLDEVVRLYKDWANARGRLDDPQDLIRLVKNAGVLEFRIAPRILPEGAQFEGLTISESRAQEYLDEFDSLGPQAARDRGHPYLWFKVPDKVAAEELQARRHVVARRGAESYILLSNRPGETMLQTKEGPQWSLKRAYPDYDPRKSAQVVGFTLDQRGADLFHTLTSTHIGDAMAILLDDEVDSAPVIQSAIRDQGIITGQRTDQEREELIRLLNAGTLRARVNPEPIAVDSIGPTLGQANIDRGWRAGWIGLLCVIAFMLIYYWVAGSIADIALAINLVLILAAMSAFDVVFTLPGIAGLILTIGIAVDANVLIFERIREERRRESNLRTAVDNAYARARSAIIDGNVTTLLICAILYWAGTQEIRGFATTLGIGITISLFTALCVTRWIFHLIGPASWNTAMAELVRAPKINWFGKRHLFWAVSAILIVAGLVGVTTRGKNLLGIEFSQGTRAVIRLNDDALIDGNLPTDARVEQALQTAAAELNVASMSGQAVQVNELRTESRVSDFITAYDAGPNGGNDDRVVSRQEWTARDRDERVFDLLNTDDDDTLTAEELDRTLPEPRYQVTSTEPNYGTVREVLNTAFEGLLSSMQKVEATLLADRTVEALNLRIGPEGYVELTEAVLDDRTVGGEFRQDLIDNAGGLLMVFDADDPEKAMTPSQLTQRLRNTRLQAGREDLQVVDTAVLPLTTAVEQPHRFTRFAVIVRSDDVEPSAKNAAAWARFAAAEKDLLTDALGSTRSLESLTNFDAAMTGRASAQALIAIGLSWLVIIGYLWWRFGSVRWGLAAVLCLIHDTLIVVGLVALCGLVASTAVGEALMIGAFKVDMAVIAAVLTVIGYSVNDTIVVFDRIRENRKRSVKVTPTILNHSINQTLARTLLTSGTTLIVVLIMYIWGGDGIHGFSFTLLAGILFGTYSSIAVASPLLLGFKQALVAKVTPPSKADVA
ncbi:MAG: protein translocase subunit SecD [Planctomycetota bacterium]